MPEEKRKQAEREKERERERERERWREGESVILSLSLVWFGLVWFCVSSFLIFLCAEVYDILFMAKVHPE